MLLWNCLVNVLADENLYLIEVLVSRINRGQVWTYRYNECFVSGMDLCQRISINT